LFDFISPLLSKSLMQISLVAMVSLYCLLGSTLFAVGRSFQCSSFHTSSIKRAAGTLRSKSVNSKSGACHPISKESTRLTASSSKVSHFSTLMEVQPVDTATAAGVVKPFQVDCITKTNNELSFVVYGEPMPLQRHRVLRSGITYNPSSKLQEQFRDSCSSFLPDSPMEGPLEARMVFYFKRPQSHYGTGKNKAVLKPGMDIWHSKRKGTFYRVCHLHHYLSRRFDTELALCVLHLTSPLLHRTRNL